MPLPLLAAVVLAVPPDPPAVCFRREVLPTFTKVGCNAGACHGTPSGKNGFRLSLRGYDPALDLHTLTREAAGRRIDRHAPDASLILAKASGRTAHEGGKRLDADGDLYKLVRAWVAQGAADDAAAGPAALEVTPARAVLDGPADVQRLRVTAEAYSTGVTRGASDLL